MSVALDTMKARARQHAVRCSPLDGRHHVTVMLRDTRPRRVPAGWVEQDERGRWRPHDLYGAELHSPAHLGWKRLADAAAVVACHALDRMDAGVSAC